MAKTEQKMFVFKTRTAKFRNLCQNIVFFNVLPCRDTANTNVFGWFVFGAGSNKSEESTGTIDTFQAPRQKYIAKKMLYTHSLEKINRGALTIFIFSAAKNDKYQCVCVCVCVCIYSLCNCNQPREKFRTENVDPKNLDGDQQQH